MHKTYDDLPPATMTLESSRAIKTGSWRAFRPILDRELCNNCYLCWKFCPDASIHILENGDIEIDLDFCKGCGICETECPKKAIELIPEEFEVKID
jgi:2-oxoacid:acceptor oxidoreductase delta subunit (pyruvate/2-ketoisovalerate family)